MRFATYNLLNSNYATDPDRADLVRQVIGSMRADADAKASP
jgi:flagellum-specific peptidoglycan hydrolase FlgJ